MSFLSDKIVTEGITFDDVLLVPAFSEVLPREVETSSRFSRNIPLNTPIVSAAMDTVTEANLAIAIAREGGIGVVHKNMSVEMQIQQVKKVKRAENVMIPDPITIPENAKVKDALSLMHEYGIGGIPVVKKDKTLIGIVTNRDLRLEKNEERLVREIMTREVITANANTNHVKAADILQSHRIEKLPIVNNKGQLIGLMTYKDITMTKDRPNSCKDQHGRLRVAAGIGVTSDTLERATGLVDVGVDALVIDTAHGHSKGVIEMAARVRKAFPHTELVVGNVGTADAARTLAEIGVDGVKVGVGPGSICTTRIIAGVGVPQLTAIYEVAQALKGTNVPVIADGGIRYSGDIVKALATGADTIMAGSLFAGVEESPGETIIYNGRKFKSYRGMGSLEAMQQGSKDRYFQDVEDDLKKLVPEGIAARVPYKGLLSEVIFQLLGGLRAGMGYCGAKNIEQLKKSKFIKITQAGMIESHPHDITITREAPNYSR